MAKKKIGHIVNTYGLKGMVKITASTNHPELRFAPGKKFLILNEMNEEQEYVITNVIHKNAKVVYVGLEGYTDINQVEWMKERDVYADVRAPKGTMFFDDLVGMTVKDAEGNTIGAVDGILTMPAGPYLEVNGGLIPYLEDVFIASADKKTKTVTLTADGLAAYASSK